MKNFLPLFAMAVLFSLTGCKEDISDFNPEGDARYKMTFTGNWTEALQGSVPGNAHFTTFIGLTHNMNGMWFDLGESASAGVEEVAETGDIDIASGEIDNIISDGNGFSKLVISVPFGPLITGSGEFTVSEDRPYVSMASMVAPSPDWFVGTRSYLLYDNDEWVDDVTFEVNTYDAGTEDGNAFSLDNPDTDPRGTITMLTRESFGTIRFERIDQ